MAKASRATIAEQTLKVIERGNYTPINASKPIQLAHKFKYAKDNTKLYTPSDKASLYRYARSEIKIDTSEYKTFSHSTVIAPQNRNYDLEDNFDKMNLEDNNNNNNNETTTTTTTTRTTTAPTFNIFNNSNNNNKEKEKEPEPEKKEKEESKKEEEEEKKEIKNYKTKIEVIKNTTLGAGQQLSAAGHDHLCLLNFASAKNPGGGFLGGAQAQEESLARSSGLYPCLTSHQAKNYYSENARDKTCVYTHHIIHSPAVPVFRNDDGDLLDQPYFPSFITAPAVNWGAALHRVDSPEVLVRAMTERAAMFLSIALKHSEETLVLGAWGCGVFRFPPEICANIFYSLLVSPNSPFYNMFKHIVFAIPDDLFVNLFTKVFSSGPVPVAADRLYERAVPRGHNKDKNNRGGYKNNNNNNNDRRSNNRSNRK